MKTYTFPDFYLLATELLDNNAHTATKYISPKEVHRATRRLYRGKIDKRGSIEVIFTIGRPNYRERAFIKKLKKGTWSFPMGQIQLKFPPKKRK